MYFLQKDDTFFFLFSLKISTWLVETIKSSNGDVVLATRAIAKELGMKNDFPVFMAVMDLAWFRPDLVDPASKVWYFVTKIVLINYYIDRENFLRLIIIR